MSRIETEVCKTNERPGDERRVICALVWTSPAAHNIFALNPPDQLTLAQRINRDINLIAIRFPPCANLLSKSEEIEVVKFLAKERIESPET